MRIIGTSINMRYVGKLDLFKSDECEKYSDKVKHRISIIEFGLKYGYKACSDAFKISKSTYYEYLKKYQAQSLLALEPKSKKPVNFRKARWNKRIIDFIINIRNKHPNIGKCKIKYFLDKFCNRDSIKTISASTIQNIINSFPNKLRTKKSTIQSIRRSCVLRKPRKYKAINSGECIALDSMEFRREGKKLYVVVAQDEATNLMYARATNSHTSRSAREVLELAHNYLPWDKYSIVLTDNGSEFGKEFAKYINEQNITHYHTYPKSPKQNARCERVNRTIQEEFMINHTNLLFTDIKLFNKKLNKYLHWYNFERPHCRFNNKLTPFQRHRELVSNDIIAVN